MRRWLIGSLAALSLLMTATATAQNVKWHPGHYMMLNGGDSVEEHLQHIDEIGREWHIQGVMVRIWWSDLEPRWYDYDFSRIDAYLERLARQPDPKHLVVRVMDRRFKTESPENIVPKYLRNDPRYNGGLVATKTGYAARLWERRVMDRLIALYRAIAERYDSHPLFEGILTEESTLSLYWWDLPEGYTNAALTEQYIRFINAVKPAMPSTQLFLNVNWLGNDELASELVEAMDRAHVAAAGSNVSVGDKTQGQRVLLGDVGRDYRWDLAMAWGVENADLGGWIGDFSAEENADYAFRELQAHYMFWVRNTWMGDETQRWYSGILPLLRTNPDVVYRCPDTYDGCMR